MSLVSIDSEACFEGAGAANVSPILGSCTIAVVNLNETPPHHVPGDSEGLLLRIDFTTFRQIARGYGLVSSGCWAEHKMGWKIIGMSSSFLNASHVG